MSLNNFTVKEFGAGNTRVVFFFCAMGTKIGLYRLPIQRMVREGFTVVAYDFERRVAQDGEPDAWLALGDAVSASVGRILDDAKRRGVTDFSCFGVSMGTLMAIRCAADHRDITKVVLNMTYGRLAENIWTWKKLSPARRRAEQLGYTLDTLDKKLAPISPIPHAAALKGKKVLLYLSKRDKVLVYTQSSQTRQALEAAGVDLTYIENKYFGHVISGYLNLSRYQVWLEFLKQPANYRN